MSDLSGLAFAKCGLDFGRPLASTTLAISIVLLSLLPPQQVEPYRAMRATDPQTTAYTVHDIDDGRSCVGRSQTGGERVSEVGWLKHVEDGRLWVIATWGRPGRLPT